MGLYFSGGLDWSFNETPVRFTQNGESLYAVLLDTPQDGRTALEKLQAQAGSTIQLLGASEPLSWTQEDGRIVVFLPPLVAAPAHTLKITPKPTLAL